MILICSITGDIHFDHLSSMVAAKLFHYKVIIYPFVINMQKILERSFETM